LGDIAQGFDDAAGVFLLNEEVLSQFGLRSRAIRRHGSWHVDPLAVGK
jgi:hypothetical protein